jgi:hypothetical protein
VGDTASSLEARLDVSFVQQMLEGNARWYYADGASRSYLEPSFNVNRQKETAFETLSATTKLLHGWGWELASGQLEFRAGPNLLFSQSVVGTGPASSTILLIETTSRWISHDYEFFTSSPRSGEFIEASAFFTQKSWVANFTAQKLQLQGEKLWNIFRYDPPLLILGVRFNVSSVFSPDEIAAADLPVQFLSFAGGETSLRGFERQSLPRSGKGAFSSAVGGVEARLHRVLFRRADVFVFNDVGALGGARFRLERPIYTSPGAGVRWESPIGVFRVYAARRAVLAQNPSDAPFESAWRLGLTYGEEF